MDIDTALAGVLDWRSPDRGKYIRVLVESDDARVDDRIEALLDEHGRTMAVAQVLCRVLAERDPNRDPSYVLEFFGKGRKGDPGDWLARKNPYRSVLLCVYGIPRLRQLKPVENLARDVRHWLSHRRGVAVLGLGDTADSAAVPHVAARLADWKPKIRVAAAAAIRRLARDGALVRESEDVVGDALVLCLSHRDDAVVRHAAAALAVPALRERLVRAQRTGGLSPVAKAAVDDALAGDVVDLIPLWPGEVTG